MHVYFLVKGYNFILIKLIKCAQNQTTISTTTKTTGI